MSESNRRATTPRRRPPNEPLGAGRYWLMLGLVMLALGALAVRIVDLHVIDRTFLQGQGDARTLRTESISAHRGMITDRYGEPLAISTPVVSLWANPEQIPEDNIQRLMLAQALGIKVDSLDKRLERYRNKEFMYLRRQMTPEAAKRVLDLGLPGVYGQNEYRRYYPSGEVSAQLLGVPAVDDQGQEGLELAYNSYLTGTPGKRRVLKDRRGRLVRDLHLLREADPGGDLTLAIDQRLQYMAYRELKAAVNENNADGGTLVMLDAHTGEVLAMANQPSYNPNNRAGLDPHGLRNQAVVDAFEPGSVMKPLAMAAALETGRYHPSTILDTAPGWMRIDGFTIRDFRNYKDLSLTDVLVKSSNIGMTRLALDIPETAVLEKYQRLGLGQSPETGYPGESAGSLPSPIRLPRSKRATLAYGYGLSVSALQIASAYTAIANGGKRVPPSLLKLNEPPLTIDAIEPGVADDVLNMLDQVVQPGTGAHRALVPGYRIAGKTGTVRKTSGTGGYKEDAYRSVFVGIAPVSNPRIVTVVMIDHPKGDEYYGGAVAAPVFSRVAGSALRLLDVPPDQPVVATEATDS